MHAAEYLGLAIIAAAIVALYAEQEKSILIPKKGPVVFPLASDQVTALLNAHAYVYRARTIMPYGEFVQAYKLTPLEKASFLLTAVKEMTSSGFGHMPQDDHPDLAYLVFPILTDLTKTNKTLHKTVCDQFIKESGKTLQEWTNEMYL